MNREWRRRLGFWIAFKLIKKYIIVVYQQIKFPRYHQCTRCNLRQRGGRKKEEVQLVLTCLLVISHKCNRFDVALFRVHVGLTPCDVRSDWTFSYPYFLFVKTSTKHALWYFLNHYAAAPYRNFSHNPKHKALLSWVLLISSHHQSPTSHLQPICQLGLNFDDY